MMPDGIEPTGWAEPEDEPDAPDPVEVAHTAHWGICSNNECNTCILVYPHSDNERDLPDQDEWDSGGIFAECYVCGADIDWGGTDPAHQLLKNY